jgi:hypothetical protein
LGRGVKPLWVFEFQIIILHLQLVLKFNVALKVESDLIVEYFNYINQGYFFVYIILSIEEKRNVWNPWYLMLEDKRGKVECKFCNNVISYHKDRMLFHLGYQYDGNG